MNLGDSVFVSLTNINEAAVDGDCELTGDDAENGLVRIIGYVQPFDENYIPENNDGNNLVVRRCGVLINVDSHENNYGDIINLVFSDGVIDIDITISIYFEVIVNNEYLVLALPREFRDLDTIEIAFRPSNAVVEGEQTSFEVDTSVIYSHVFNIIGDSDTVLKTSFYQPFSTVAGRFMKSSGDATLTEYAKLWDEDLLPFFSQPVVYEAAIGYLIAANLA